MLKIFLIFWIVFINLYALSIEGNGISPIEKKAKKEALEDLSNNISVEVKSEFISQTKVTNKSYKKVQESLLHLSSHLPIKGVTYHIQKENDLFKVTASLSSERSLNVYKEELIRLKENIQKSSELLNHKQTTQSKYIILNNLLQDIENFNAHKTVAMVLGGEDLPSISLTKNEVILQMKKIEKDISSIALASKVVTKEIEDYQPIYISAIRVSGSNEITQFAKLFKESLATDLHTTKYSDQAHYFLRGDYEILKNTLFVTLYLSDAHNNILKTFTLKLQEDAYKDTKYKPSIKSFDESIRSDFVQSGNLSVKIGFKGYLRDNGIDLYGGDHVDIVVKTNKPICYFLLGHTLKKDEKFSYLLPIGSDEAPFTNKITGAEVNTNVTILDDILIDKPYGNENLQIFASTLKKDGQCPLAIPKCQENEDGYCIVYGKPSKVVGHTRALNLKKRSHKIQKAEDSISWTSFRH